jgi:hypothetical protein
VLLQDVRNCHEVNAIGAGIFLMTMVCWILQEPLSSNQDAGNAKPNIGVVIFERGTNEERSTKIADHLHFCVFENGKNDAIYVATLSGGWFGGHFELMLNSKIVAHVNVPDLVYGGVMIPIGDAIDEIPKEHRGMGGPAIYVSNVQGVLK